MLERNGNMWRASYLKAGNWQVLFEEQCAIDKPLFPYLITSNSDNNPAWEVALDNFSFTPIPEPSSIALWCAGMVGIGFGRRRRRR